MSGPSVDNTLRQEHYVNASDVTHTQCRWPFTMAVQHSSPLSTFDLIVNKQLPCAHAYARSKRLVHSRLYSIAIGVVKICILHEYHSKLGF